MHKRLKLDGHNAHVLRDEAGRDTGYLYTVNPEKERATAWVQIHTLGHPETREYVKFVTLPICSRKLGQLGYLQSIIRKLRDEAYLMAGFQIKKYDGSIMRKIATKIIKEEKKMHKKTKINGHVMHKLPKCEDLYYTVEPENGRIYVYKLAYIDSWTRESNYEYYGYINICANQLGRHGYLQDQVNYLAQRYSDNTTQTALNDTMYKEGKKMGEIRKDRITLNASDGCYLEIFNKSNTIVFHFGTESRAVTVPDDYEINWGVKEMGTCNLHIEKKKPSLLTGTLRFWPFVFRDGVSRRYIHNLVGCDPFQTLRVVDGRVMNLPFDKYLSIYDDIFNKTYSDKDELISDFRKLFDDRKIFANASNLNVVFEPDRS